MLNLGSGECNHIISVDDCGIVRHIAVVVCEEGGKASCPIEDGTLDEKIGFCFHGSPDGSKNAGPVRIAVLVE